MAEQRPLAELQVGVWGRVRAPIRCSGTVIASRSHRPLTVDPQGSAAPALAKRGGPIVSRHRPKFANKLKPRQRAALNLSASASHSPALAGDQLAGAGRLAGQLSLVQEDALALLVHLGDARAALQAAQVLPGRGCSFRGAARLHVACPGLLARASRLSSWRFAQQHRGARQRASARWPMQRLRQPLMRQPHRQQRDRPRLAFAGRCRMSFSGVPCGGGRSLYW